MDEDKINTENIEDMKESHADSYEWIPCECRFPPPYTLVLIQVEKIEETEVFGNQKYIEYYLARIDEEDEWLCDTYFNGDVVAWTKVPMPYVKQSELEIEQDNICADM